MEFSCHPKCTEKPQSSISTHPFSDVPSFSKRSKSTGQNEKIGKQCFLLLLFFNISLRDTTFFISLNSLGIYLSIMLFEFSLTCIFQHVWKNFFNLWFSYSKKTIASMLFLMIPQSPTQYSWQIFLKICFPQDRSGGRKL